MVELLIWAFLSEKRAHAHVDQRRARPHSSTRFIGKSSAALHRICSRMSLNKCVFDMRESLPCSASQRTQRVTRTVDAVCFSGAAMECSKCVCVFSSFQWRMFYKQGPGRCWICTSFAIKTWSGPSDKRPHSCKSNCIRFLSFVGNPHISKYMLMETTRNLSIIAPPTARLQELCFFQRESESCIFLL